MRGRPKKIERITIDEGISLLKEMFHKEYSRQTIYNNISLKKLTSYGTFDQVILDRGELVDWHLSKLKSRRTNVA